MAASFMAHLLGPRRDGNPNICDKDSSSSLNISRRILELVGAPSASYQFKKQPGTPFEHAIAAHLEDELPALAPPKSQWDVKYKGNPIDSFAQYEHLAKLTEVIDADSSGTLKLVVGGDYLVKQDVTVGRRVGDRNFLHASVSCKWTIRSDRAQNSRTEAGGLLRHRKGRAPHIVVVTAEPLPTRLASIGMGTGDMDAIYHATFVELLQAVGEFGTDGEKSTLDLLVQGGRLRDYEELPLALVQE